MRILVTAGPTREFFDSVRFISNSSSGKMGFAIAEEASRRGHEVVLVCGPVDMVRPKGVRLIRVVSADEMLRACVGEFDKCGAAVMTAAVCDYRPARRLGKKLKKQDRVRVVRLNPTVDVLARLGRRKGRRVVIGFAMEDHNAQANAEAKMRRKHCDAIVLNGPGNIGGDGAEIQVLRRRGGWSKPVKGSKTRVARYILDVVEELAEADQG